MGLIIDYREAWLFGTNSVEVWYNAGLLDFPLQRVQGAFNEIGCAAPYSIAKMDNGIFWLGKDARGQGLVYRANGYTGQRLSPDYGANGSGGQGFSHFPAPLSRYSNWYRPRALTLQASERCQPDLFRPRGLGTLFAEHRDGYRDHVLYAMALATGMREHELVALDVDAQQIDVPRCPGA